MVNNDFDKKIDTFTQCIIRRKVKQLVFRSGFMAQDREDLEQDLMLRVLQSLPSLDPMKAHRNKFITAVVERCVANILRDKRAGKRDWRRATSLSATITIVDDKHVTLVDCITQDDADARLGRRTRSDQDQAGLRCDIATVIRELPDELRELAERLQTQNVSEIARETGVPRTTLNDSVRRLRRRFERLGLREYLS